VGKTLIRAGTAAAFVLTAGLIAGALLEACTDDSNGGEGSSACGTGASNPCFPAPTVSITAPASGAAVNGTVWLTASASVPATDGVTVSSVEFLVDGTMVETTTTVPYTDEWLSTTVANGQHTITAVVTDSMGTTVTSSPVMVNVENVAATSSVMSPAQIFPAPRSAASGIAHLTFNFASAEVSGSVRLERLAAGSVTLNQAFSGATGPVVIRLAPGAAGGEWLVPSGALLAAEQLLALQRGGLYVIATSAAYPHGEIRGQIALPNITVTFSELSRTDDVPQGSTALQGVVATTVDASAHTLSVHVNSSGVDDADASEVDKGADRSEQLAALTKDPVDMGHWSTELAPITAADIDDFRAGRWSVRVATPVVPSGALRAGIKPDGAQPRLR
jgi:Bacterial Ig domain/CHRD domain